MPNNFSKPQITIDLDEYEYLKGVEKSFERQLYRDIVKDEDFSNAIHALINKVPPETIKKSLGVNVSVICHETNDIKHHIYPTLIVLQKDKNHDIRKGNG